jgi:DNA-binding response OmpR family regulator
VQHTHTILLASHDQKHVDELATQLVIDGHDVHTAATAAHATAKLATQAIDVIVLGELDRPAAATRLLVDLRAGALHRQIHPATPVVTTGGTDTLSTLRAYEAGSDHHVAVNTDMLVLRAILTAVTRRVLAEAAGARVIRVGDLEIDTAARTAHVGDQTVKLSRTEFDLLAKLATDPHRVMSKTELMRTVWGPGADTGRTRTLDSHACRLRSRLAAAGARDLVRTRWGQGYQLVAEATR